MGVEPIRLQDMGRLAMPSVGADARVTRIPGGRIPNTYSPASQGPNFSIGLFLTLSRFLSLFATPSLGQGSGCSHSFTQYPFPLLCTGGILTHQKVQWGWRDGSATQG